MEKAVFSTSKGPVTLRGWRADLSAERPLLLVVRGAFPEWDQLIGLGESFPHADVVLVDLPGMLSSFFEEDSIRAFAAGFDEMLGLAFPGRRVNLLGLSMGGLVALAMRSPAIRSVIGVDPPLSTAGLWPLRQPLEAALAYGPRGRMWIKGLFGLGPEGQEDRDHRWVLEGLRVPTKILLGSDPLFPVRAITRTPSLVSEDDRALYRDHPRINVQVVENTGHDIPSEGRPALLQSLGQAIPSPRATTAS